MDRRSLVVGAAAFAAVAGTRIPAAHASGGDTGRDTTIAHARQVLELLNTERGLVDPETARARTAETLTAYRSSPPRDPNANDLFSWTENRRADLTATQIRTLTAFSFLLSTQYQDRQAAPEVTRGMPLPAGLETLEPDFFPELHRQIEIRTRSSPAFDNLLQAAAAELDNITFTLQRAQANDSDKWILFGICLLCWTATFVYDLLHK